MKNNCAVVIVTYNGSHWIEKNISSLLKSSFPITIIVVDNASTDTTLAILEKFPEIYCIKSEVNLGFGKANNIGIRYAIENDFNSIFLLNQDTWVFENTIKTLIEKLKLFPEFGILSPLHFSSDEIKLDKNFESYYNRKTHFFDNSLAEVPFVNAAAWLINSSCIKKAGLFAPEFNHYGEDRNYCDRLHYHGLKIGICTESKIVHDREVVVNFNKDTLQSQYKVLNALLNINNSYLKSIVLGLKEVFGLPKYFLSRYGIKKAVFLFYKLFKYFFNQLFNWKAIWNSRAIAKVGKTGY